MNELQKIFDYSGIEVRTIIKNGEPWFVAKDICDILEIKDPSMALTRLNDNQKGTINIGTLGGKQNVLSVSEAGLYKLIFTSRKEEAITFQDWVCEEVLPSIRKTGQFKLDELVKQSLLSYDPIAYLTYAANFVPSDSPEAINIQNLISKHTEINKNSLQIKSGFNNHKRGYVCIEEIVQKYMLDKWFWLNLLRENGCIETVEVKRSKGKRSSDNVSETHLTAKGRELGGEQAPHKKKRPSVCLGIDYTYRFPEIAILELYGIDNSHDNLEMLKVAVKTEAKKYNNDIDNILFSTDKHKAINDLMR